MLDKDDRERITTLLKATICLLCKNGISFKEKFTIDAVIGVTVDDSDVILVSMNELIQAASSQNSHKKISSNMREDNDHHQLIEVNGRKRRCRHLSCEHNDDGNDGDDDLDLLISDSPGAAQSAISLSNENSNSSTDLVFVKQEMMDDNWPNSDDAMQCAGILVSSLERKVKVSPASAEHFQSGHSQDQHSWVSANHESGTIAPLFVMDALIQNGSTASGDNNNKPIHNRRLRHHQLRRLHQVITQKPRKTYSAAFKLEVIKYAEEHGGNRAAQRKYGVNEKCIRNWRKEKQRFTAEYEASINTDCT